MIFYLDILKFIIASSYWAGLVIIPIVLWTYVFQGIYFNLSFWYKLTDMTRWGAYFSFISLIINLLLQIIFVPKLSYVASAFSAGISYFVVMLLSYFIGKKHLNIPYDLRSIGVYTLFVLLLLGCFYALNSLLQLRLAFKLLLGTCLLACYIIFMIRKDFPLSSLPIIGKYFKK